MLKFQKRVSVFLVFVFTAFTFLSSIPVKTEAVVKKSTNAKKIVTKKPVEVKKVLSPSPVIHGINAMYNLGDTVSIKVTSSGYTKNVNYKVVVTNTKTQKSFAVTKGYSKSVSSRTALVFKYSAKTAGDYYVAVYAIATGVKDPKALTTKKAFKVVSADKDESDKENNGTSSSNDTKVVIDKKVLSSAVDSAKALIESKKVGAAIENVTQSAKDEFQAAIDAAAGVNNDSSVDQAKVDVQVTELAKATTNFNNAVIKPVGVTEAKLITDSVIEIYYNQDVKYADWAGYFEVYVDGKQLTLWDDYTFVSYFNNMTTLQLTKPVTDTTKKIEVKVNEAGKRICNANGDKITTLEKVQAVRDPYYVQQVISSVTKVPVIASKYAQNENMNKAAAMIDTMLSKRADIAAAMVANGAKLAIIPAGQQPYIIPESRSTYTARYAEGYGGSVEQPLTTISEINIARYVDSTKDKYVTGYKNENILAHEFGHAVHLIGLVKLNDNGALLNEVEADYANAKAKGLFPNTYLMSNSREYFATGTAMWFNGMSESKKGNWDGVRGPINTREELKNYDPNFYNTLAKIYPDTAFTAPWDNTPNTFDANGDKLVGAPILEYAKLITNKDIEIKYDDTLKNIDKSSDFEVYMNGSKLAGDKYTLLPYFNRMITLRLVDPITDAAMTTAQAIEVKIADATIMNTNGSKPAESIAVVKDPFYAKTIISKTGITVVGSKNVLDTNLQAAANIVDVMTAKLPAAVVKALIDNKAKLSVYEEGMNAYYIPEHREFYDSRYLYVEGLGGCADEPTTSIAEVNLGRYLDLGKHSTLTNYKNENLIAHEFGHAIHLVGLTNGAPELCAQLQKVYDHAKANGLWPKSYAIGNWEEYFATGTAIWFNVMSESKNGTWDGVRGPVNTRDELKKYDIDFYNFLSTLYNETSFAAPWDKTPNLYDENGVKLPCIIDANTYFKVSSKSVNEILEVWGPDKNIGTKIGTWSDYDKEGQGSQRYRFIDAGNGFVKIYNKYSGLYLEIKSATDTAIQNSKNDLDSQLWKLDYADGGNIKIINKANGLVLERKSDSDGGGTLFLSTYTGSDSQLWIFTEVEKIAQ